MWYILLSKNFDSTSVICLKCRQWGVCISFTNLSKDIYSNGISRVCNVYFVHDNSNIWKSYDTECYLFIHLISHKLILLSICLVVVASFLIIFFFLLYWEFWCEVVIFFIKKEWNHMWMQVSLKPFDFLFTINSFKF